MVLSYSAFRSLTKSPAFCDVQSVIFIIVRFFPPRPQNLCLDDKGQLILIDLDALACASEQRNTQGKVTTAFCDPMFCLDRHHRFSHENDRFSMLVAMMSIFEGVTYRVWIAPELDEFWAKAWDADAGADAQEGVLHGHRWATKNCYTVRRRILKRVEEVVGQPQRQSFVAIGQYYYSPISRTAGSTAVIMGDKRSCGIIGGKKVAERWR